MQRIETAVDKFGRVLIPKSVRNHLGLKAGVVLQICEKGQTLLLETREKEPLVKFKEGIAVFTGQATGDLKASVTQSRDERLKKIGF